MDVQSATDLISETYKVAKTALQGAKNGPVVGLLAHLPPNVFSAPATAQNNTLAACIPEGAKNGPDVPGAAARARSAAALPRSKAVPIVVSLATVMLLSVLIRR